MGHTLSGGMCAVSGSERVVNKNFRITSKSLCETSFICLFLSIETGVFEKHDLSWLNGRTGSSSLLTDTAFSKSHILTKEFAKASRSRTQ